MRRILIYTHDTFGLGNVRRMMEIARHLTASSPDVEVLIITGSPMLHAFRIPPRVDYVKLPCLSRTVEGRYGARYLDLSLDATVALRANLIRSTLEHFAPDLVLVDKKPFGVEDELSGALAAISEGGTRPKLVLLLRDILDAPAETSRVWRKNGYFEAISAYYDQVLVVGSPEVFDLRREYAFPPFAAARVRFCGYIARQPGRQSRAALRSSLAVAADEPLVLVTTGGGEDGHGLVSAWLAALASLPAGRRPRTHVVCGPEMGDANRQSIHRAVAALPEASLQDFSDDMMSLIDAADVVVSMGGYNTVCELLTARKHAVVVPRTKPGLEQCIRAERMAALGLFRMLHPDRLTPASLLEAVQAELAAIGMPARRSRLKPLNGLDHVADAVFDLIGVRRPLPAPAAAAVAHTHPSSREHAAWHVHAQTPAEPSPCW